MKVGDLVKHANSPTFCGPNPGIIVGKIIRDYGNVPSRIYKVLWSDNIIATAWDYDLEIINESR